jgi:alkanesulfonate monooxygenase SsuD/methylene tetrahydromethanopterin reductase-like flavin-dependent oxidoreductase (luciferase family)
MFTMRFDMRMAPCAGSAGDLYAAALDMCAWAETRGALLVVLSEHHGTADGHLPVPLIFASALAARTSTLQILLAAVPLPLWDPVRLAEEIAVLDVISGGRVSYALGVGHRVEEYAHFGAEFSQRGQLADEYLPLVRRLVRGETVERNGVDVQVTPASITPGGPTMLVAGGSRAAARRAGRNGMGFISQSPDPQLKELYEQACKEFGHKPGIMQFPVNGSPTAVFVCDDPDSAWAELGPYLLHDAMMAASYRHGDDSVASITQAQTIGELRRSAGPYSILTGDQAAERLKSGQILPLHPLCGGIPPELAWPYLRAAADCAAAGGGR